MANTGIEVDDDTLDEFDRLIMQKKADGDIDMDKSRSAVIEDLMEDWIEENQAGNGTQQTAAMTAD